MMTFEDKMIILTLRRPPVWEISGIRIGGARIPDCYVEYLDGRFDIHLCQVSGVDVGNEEITRIYFGDDAAPVYVDIPNSVIANITAGAGESTPSGRRSSDN